ncbi:MAG: amidohydrolase family protein [Flavobacteriaceae bacterium]
MNIKISRKDTLIFCTNCITGKTEEIGFKNGQLMNISESETKENNLPFIAPGLTDLQINGINGIDFNTATLTQEDVVNATHYLLSQGVTTFLPTVITNSDDNIITLVRTINEACKSNPLVEECVWGIHLEGPFISPKEGAKGAHDEKHIKAPDWDLFCKFQEAAGGKIRIVTIAPEWEGSCSFIEKCREHGIIVAIGHSLANAEQISMAIKAGMTLSTHLGNGIPLLLKRHPNMIWDQLAADELYSCIITDGIHTPKSFIKVVMKNKGKHALMVSDATCYAGMPPGEYQSHIGGSVILDEEKRVSLKGSHGILAGAAKSLLENVETLMNLKLATLNEAWEMASINVSNMLIKHDSSFYENNNDKVIFRLEGKDIIISTVIKNGEIVFEN